MWNTKIGTSICRHFSAHEDETFLRLECRRCDHAMLLMALAPLIYVLAECIHHLSHVHGFPGATGGWTGYLDALPAPGNHA